MNTINKDIFIDKVHGCWYGKCLGGAAGAPFEGIKRLIDIKDFTLVYNPALPNDDLDLQLLWLETLERKGFALTSCDLADAWIKKCWYPFSEYGYFMKNYMRGIKPPYTGIINNSFYKEGMGCPIRSEIWGIICAGKPELAIKYAYLDGCLDHSDNAIYAEQFLAALESMAFFESDINVLVENGMKFIPKESKLHKCFDLILSLKNQPWEKVRQLVINRFGHPDFTNCVQNLGFILIALLFGNCDMRDTINIALRCGYDTDCTCASVASIVGIIKGYSGLGDLCGLINDSFVCGIDVKRPSNSIKHLAEDCVALVEKMPETVEIMLENPTFEGLQKSIKCIDPVKWYVYGPYFHQLNQPMNPDYPSPHPEGCVLPDLVCMVNNEVFIDRDYKKGELAYVIDAYEDLIDIDNYITMEGQYACFAETCIIANEDRKVWIIIGNNDGFSLRVNGEKVLEKDEIRLWTPQNNFCLVNLKRGENKIELKLLRRTERLRFSIGFRNYDDCHWHKSKWCTDLKYGEIKQ